MPTLLSAAIGVLGWMAVNIQEMSTGFAVLKTIVTDYERRISNLETLFLGSRKP